MAARHAVNGRAITLYRFVAVPGCVEGVARDSVVR